MKQNSRAFTLIELLAVIVILGIIAVIAVPIVKNITKDAKMKSFMNSARGIIRAGDLYYSRKDMMDEVNGDMIFEFPNNASELELNGKLPETGKMIITEDGDIALAISNGKYCITKKIEDEDITITEDNKDCRVILPYSLTALATTSTEVTEVPTCVIDATTCAPGTPVAIKVNENDIYNFYVMNEIDDEVTLIMDRNLGDNVEWLASTISTVQISDGPKTALNALATRTSNWTNIPKRRYTLSGLAEDGTTHMYEDKIVKARARLITYNEANDIFVQNGDILPNWMYINLKGTGADTDSMGKIIAGYWTSTADSGNSYKAVFINPIGRIVKLFVYVDTSGIRPVITLYK